MKTAAMPDDESDRLRLLRELRFEGSPPEAALAALTRSACRLTQQACGVLCLVGEHEVALYGGFGLPGLLTTFAREPSLASAAIAAGEMVEVVDAPNDPRYREHPLVARAPHLRHMSAVPVLVEGRAVAALWLGSTEAGCFDADQRAALADLAELAGSVLVTRLHEQRLRLQEARLRTASRASQEWLWETDAQGRLTWMAGGIGDVAAPILGQALPLERPTWESHLAQRAEQQPFQEAIVDGDTPTGRLALSISGLPVFNAVGEFMGYRGASRNVTAEVEARHEARQAQALLESALEGLPGGVMITAPDGRILMKNGPWRRAIRQWLGAAKVDSWDEVVQRLVAAGAYPEAVGREAEFIAWRMSLETTDEGVRHELRFGDAWTLVSDRRLPDGNVVHLNVDITDRKRAVLEREAEQARAQAVLRAVPDLWFVIDADGRYADCSNDQHPLLVTPFTRLRGLRFGKLLPPAIAHLGLDALKTAHATGDLQRFEYELTTHDGTHRSLEARVVPMPEGRSLYLVRDLTEVRRLERDVQLMQRALEAEASLPITVADATHPNWPLVYVNPAFERLSGWRRDELLGRNARLLQGASRAQPALDTLRKALKTGEPCTVLLENQRRDGTRFLNELHVAPVRDAAGRITHFVGVQKDVTERERNAQKLQVSEALYRSVATAISDGLVVMDAEARLVAVNPSAGRLLGMDPARLLGRRLGELEARFTDEQGQPVHASAQPIDDVLRRGRPAVERTLTLHRADGSVRQLRASFVPLALGSAELPISCVATFRDITAEQAAAQALADAEQRWKVALEAVVDGVWDFDTETGRVYYSRSWKAMLGHAENEIGDSIDEWIERVHPEDRRRIKAEIADYRRGSDRSYQSEHRLRHKDGHYLHILDRGKTVDRRDDGQPRRVVGTHTDITRQKTTEQALLDKQAAELASRAKSEFLSRMSHEMRTPLNAVIGFTQLLQLRADHAAPALVSQYSQHILQAGQHLLALVNDVLDLQRVEEGMLALELQPLELESMLRHAFDFLGPSAIKRQVRVVHTMEPSLHVLADPQRLRQVILNIGSNGIKYNRVGGELRCIARAVDDAHVCITIEDTGPGLTPQQTDRLFQPFERLGRETSSTEGTGLGLIIARRLVEEMGGQLTLSSEAGRGTRVSIELPRAVALSNPPQKVQPMTARSLDHAAGEARERLRMLYVEDNRINALLFEETLRLRADIDLRIAEDGPEALSLVEAWQPHVLVLDAHLPGASGHEVLGSLRALPGLDRAPAFMCSADALPEDVQRALEAGFDGYWTKPIDIDRVLRDLERVAPAPPLSA